MDEAQSFHEAFGPQLPVAQHPVFVSPQMLSAIEKYSGKQDPAAWTDKLEMYATMYRWDQATCLNVARLCLAIDSNASRWAKSKHWDTWVEFRNDIIARFGESPEAAAGRFSGLKQRANESGEAFIDRFMELAYKCGRTEDAALRADLVSRLNHELKKEVARQKLPTIKSIIDFCVYWAGVTGIESSADSPKHTADDTTLAGPTREPAHAERRPLASSNNFNRNRQDPRGFNNGRNWSDTSGHRNFRPNSGSYRPPAPHPPANHNSGVDDLTKQLKELKLQLMELGSEVRNPQRSQGQSMRGASHDMHFCDFGSVPAPEQAPYTVHHNEVETQELFTHDELLIKRPLEDTDPVHGQRAPHKRVAIDPHANSVYAPVKATVPPPPPPARAASGPLPAAELRTSTPRRTTSGRIPYNRTPISSSRHAQHQDGVTPGHAGPMCAGPSVGAPAKHNSTGSYSAAAEMAESKGKELAHNMAKSIKLDGVKEGSVVVQAILYCAAGFLLKDNRIVDFGKRMASQVEDLIGKMIPVARTSSSAPASIYVMPEESTTELYRHTASHQPTRTTTCMVDAAIGRHHFKAVVDTGASGSAFGWDFCRRLGLQDRILQDDVPTFTNADGSTSKAKGRLEGIPLTLGSTTTIVSPTVTGGLYNALIGNDVLKCLNAQISFGNRTLLIEVDPSTVQELPIECDTEGSTAVQHLNMFDTNVSAAVKTAQSNGSSPPAYCGYMDIQDNIPPVLTPGDLVSVPLTPAGEALITNDISGPSGLICDEDVDRMPELMDTMSSSNGDSSSERDLTECTLADWITGAAGDTNSDSSSIPDLVSDSEDEGEVNQDWSWQQASNKPGNSTAAILSLDTDAAVGGLVNSCQILMTGVRHS